MPTDLPTLPSVAPPGREALRAPDLALPTVVLATATFSLWVAVGCLAAEGVVPLWVACLANSIMAYISFTPQHDAVHGSVSIAHPWLNGLVGRMCGIPLFSPFPAFRRLHLAHHKHTNDPHRDPDFWSGKGPWYMLPLRWMTQEWRYWVVSATVVKETVKARKREVGITLVVLYSTALALSLNGHGWAVLWAWLVPSRLANTMLAFLFDYLPHRPHQVRLHEDPFKATRNIEGQTLAFFFLSQNYHQVHHIFPSVPFYRYLRIWKRHRGWFESKASKQSAQV